jgi:hypothetical protein
LDINVEDSSTVDTFKYKERLNSVLLVIDNIPVELSKDRGELPE